MEASKSLILEGLKVEDKKELDLLEKVSSYLLDKDSVELIYTISDGIDEKINLRCLKTDKYKIAIKTHGRYTEDGGGLERLEISWLDTETKKGSCITYTIGSVIGRQISRIKKPNDWINGDIHERIAVYSFGDSVESKKLPIEEVLAVLSESVSDPELQEKVVYWPKEWYGAYITGETKVEVI